MLRFREKKKMTILILLSISLFFLSGNFCYGKNNISKYQDENLSNQIKETQKSDKTKEEKNKDYVVWKDKYEQAQKKAKKSKTLIIIGTVTMVGGLATAYLSRKKETKGGGAFYYGGMPVGSPGSRFFWGKTPAVETEEYNEVLLIGGIVVMGVGSTLAVLGAIKQKKAKKQKEALEEEGKTKGYLNVRVNPAAKSIAISYVIEF